MGNTQAELKGSLVPSKTFGGQGLNPRNVPKMLAPRPNSGPCLGPSLHGNGFTKTRSNRHGALSLKRRVWSRNGSATGRPQPTAPGALRSVWAVGRLPDGQALGPAALVNTAVVSGHAPSFVNIANSKRKTTPRSPRK